MTMTLTMVRASVMAVMLAAWWLTAMAQGPSPAPARQPSSSSPAVSPDGRFVAFVSDRGGNPDLYLVSAAGGEEKRLTNTPEAEGRAEWSSDGKRLLYGIGSGETTLLYALDVATLDRREIGTVRARGAVLSPDGKRIAYMSGSWQASRLAVADVDGSNERVLTTAEQSGVAWNARFSPDGQQIAFTGQDASRQLHVFIVGIDGSGFRQLTRFSADEGRAQVPAWSADGRQIAFQLNRKGTSDLWRVAVAGGEPTAITTPGAGVLDEVPSWFADGSRVAFQSTRSGRMEIWTVAVDGSSPGRIAG